MKKTLLTLAVMAAVSAGFNAMAYVQIDDLKGKIPTTDLTAALDDNKDGEIDSDVWAQIQADVQSEIDGVLGQRYEVPFTDPIPAVVTLAAKRFAIESVWARRGFTDEKLPYVVDANASRKTLAAIALGTQPLWPDQHRKNPVGAVITEKARTQPRHCDRSNI